MNPCSSPAFASCQSTSQQELLCGFTRGQTLSSSSSSQPESSCHPTTRICSLRSVLWNSPFVLVTETSIMWGRGRCFTRLFLYESLRRAGRSQWNRRSSTVPSTSRTASPGSPGSGEYCPLQGIGPSKSVIRRRSSVRVLRRILNKAVEWHAPRKGIFFLDKTPEFDFMKVRTSGITFCRLPRKRRTAKKREKLTVCCRTWLWCCSIRRSARRNVIGCAGSL
jgi:hypothetical protein